MRRKLLAVAITILSLTSCSLLPNANARKKTTSTPRYEECLHQFGPWEESCPATCTEAGERRHECEICGYTAYDVIRPLGHDFENGEVLSDTSTCTSEGVLTTKCTRCEETYSRTVAGDHFWANSQTVNPSSSDQISYVLSTCRRCNKTKLSFNALDGTLIGSSAIKSGTPSGYMKLNADGDSISYKLSCNTALSGTLYARAIIDNYTNTSVKEKTFRDDDYGYHFRVIVNARTVDLSSVADIPYSTLFADGESHTLGSSYSPIKNCKLGTVNLVEGVNNIDYERLASFNLLISEFIIISD